MTVRDLIDYFGDCGPECGCRGTEPAGHQADAHRVGRPAVGAEAVVRRDTGLAVEPSAPDYLAPPPTPEPPDPENVTA